MCVKVSSREINMSSIMGCALKYFNLTQKISQKTYQALSHVRSVHIILNVCLYVI